MARRKFSIKISVFFTSEEYTSDPTMGQNGICKQVVFSAAIKQENITIKKTRKHIKTTHIEASQIYLASKFLGDTQSQSCLPGTWWASQ